MLIHLIHHKGKGRWVIGAPLVISIVLFIFFDALALNDKYIASITLLLSACIIYLIDDKRQTSYEGDIVKQRVKGPRSKNSFMSINMRYRAFVLAIAGVVAMFNIN